MQLEATLGISRASVARPREPPVSRLRPTARNLPACGCIEEERANHHRRSPTPNRIVDLVQAPAVHPELGTAAFDLGCGEDEPGDRGDRGQGLAAKAEGRDADEVGDAFGPCTSRAVRGRGWRRRAPYPAVIADLIKRRAAILESTCTCRAPASRAFSTSSFTADAGRSTTSPAAIWSATASGKMATRLDMGEFSRRPPRPRQPEPILLSHRQPAPGPTLVHAAAASPRFLRLPVQSPGRAHGERVGAWWHPPRSRSGADTRHGAQGPR